MFTLYNFFKISARLHLIYILIFFFIYYAGSRMFVGLIVRKEFGVETFDPYRPINYLSNGVDKFKIDPVVLEIQSAICS